MYDNNEESRSLKGKLIEVKILVGKMGEAILQEQGKIPGSVRWGLKESADLIVMGTHGKTGIEHRVVGCTAGYGFYTKWLKRFS